MEPLDPERNAEHAAKFSVQWYISELQNLFNIADLAKTNTEPVVDHIIQALQTLDQDFLEPDQIDAHVAMRSIDVYRAQAKTSTKGTADHLVTVEIGKWLRVCEESMKIGLGAEQISIRVRPLIQAKLRDLKPEQVLRLTPLPDPASIVLPPPPEVPRVVPSPPDLPPAPIPVLRRVPPRAEPIPPAPQRSPEVPLSAAIETIPSEEAERILANTEIHGEAFNGKTLTVAMLRGEQLGPCYRTSIDGQMVWFASAAYPVFDRLAVVAYVEQSPGRYTARTYYRSNSHGVWKYLPRYNAQDAHVYNFGKGFGQESITLPWRSQKALAEVSRQQISVSDPALVFVGTARSKVGRRVDDTYQLHVRREGAGIAGMDQTRPREGKPRPESVEIEQFAQRPNFARRLDGWNYTTDIYGEVQAEVFASNDDSLQFVFCRDRHNRVWIASVENVNAAPGPTGLRGEWINAKDLTTPAFDYYEDDGGFGNTALRAGKNYVDMYLNYISKIPIIREYLRFFGIPEPTPVSPAASKPLPDAVAPAAVLDDPFFEESPAVPPPSLDQAPQPVPPKSKGRLPYVAVAAATLGAAGLAYYGAQERPAASTEQRQEQVDLSRAYAAIPPELRTHVVGVVLDGERVDMPKREGWVKQSEYKYLWGTREVLAQPNGSALYIPDGTPYNKAFMLPPDARGNIDWRAVRFPIQAIQKMELTLGVDGLWHDPQNRDYAVLDGGHLLMIEPSGHTSQFIPFNESSSKSIGELADYYKLPVDMNSIDTSVPTGFVDMEAQPSLASIQCDLNFKTYDNTYAGVPIYPDDYKCLIPEQAVADFAAVEAELIAHGYHLGITEAKRPLSVQKFLYELLPPGVAAKPTDKAPHVRGYAYDVQLLDNTYIPVFASGFQPVKTRLEKTKGLSTPLDQQAAKQDGWSDTEYAQFKTLQEAFEAHGFKFSTTERWHVDYQR